VRLRNLAATRCGVSIHVILRHAGIIPLALFSKTPVELELTGITNDDTDLSVDVLRAVTLPLLQNFGVWGATLEVKRRGCRPLGGGRVILKIPPVKTALKPLHVTEEGLVKRVRGERCGVRSCCRAWSRCAVQGTFFCNRTS
jgi:RNA 3'-terminal phosphate cyclase-like protein